jgi:hypothetical protein
MGEASAAEPIAERLNTVSTSGAKSGVERFVYMERVSPACAANPQSQMQIVPEF